MFKVGELCAELRNYFLRDRMKDIHTGRFTISEGRIEPLSFLQLGQYFRIVGSVFNDGVYVYGSENLEDETFNGSIWAMAVPKEAIELAEEIDKWMTDNADALSKPYQSESFGGYSYSKGSGGNGSGSGYSWQDHFASRLGKWRRVSVL